ncbi:hypothetical protein K7X08_025831 [Anisodus acutangulus]|uniref:Uncharacterized protein n=1 Tax=Anisodus acutangulus TaxID=402998 RepID=A0A9Q1QW07_9SOLA|nr:hypothetical protein K7X08_025831 [Anisodus acutangulus]
MAPDDGHNPSLGCDKLDIKAVMPVTTRATASHRASASMGKGNDSPPGQTDRVEAQGESHFHVSHVPPSHKEIRGGTLPQNPQDKVPPVLQNSTPLVPSPESSEQGVVSVVQLLS